MELSEYFAKHVWLRLTSLNWAELPAIMTQRALAARIGGALGPSLGAQLPQHWGLVYGVALSHFPGCQCAATSCPAEGGGWESHAFAGACTVDFCAC